jgi:hypothetical protein
MPRLSKATVLDKWLDNFSDMDLDDQAFALAQVSAIHRQAQRQDAKNGKTEPASEPDDLPFDDVKVSGT